MAIKNMRNVSSIVLSILTILFLIVPDKLYATHDSDQNNDPTQCNYAPEGEYIKDHTIIFYNGWYHLFSISGTKGYYHGCNGNEETISWSISKDLVNWEMRGHILHASQRKGAFDQHEVWAPFCLIANEKFYLFYTGVIHPFRPLTYGKPGPDHKWIYEGHKETQGLAVSDDLTDWVKIADTEQGLGIPGRDSHVVWNEDAHEWLLYSTGPVNSDGLCQSFVSRSINLINWNFWGVCALIPGGGGNSESQFIMRHPLTTKWILLANNKYAISDNPLSFLASKVMEYDRNWKGKKVSMGLAGEMIQYKGKWYRSGFIGPLNYTKLCFTEIEWEKEGAFKIIKPSIQAF